MPNGTIFYMIITPLVTVFLIFALRFIIKKLEKTLEKENLFSKLNVEKRQLQDRMEEKKGIRSDVGRTDGMRKQLLDFARKNPILFAQYLKNGKNKS
jgi:hypothetical protein